MSISRYYSVLGYASEYRFMAMFGWLSKRWRPSKIANGFRRYHIT